jgi:hypothetical protein
MNVMLRRLLLLLPVFCLAAGSVCLLSCNNVQAMSFADAMDNACSKATGNPYCDTRGNTTNSIAQTIGNITKVAATIGGIGAVIMIIYGGLRYVISYGEPQKTVDARRTIIYALVGLIVIIVGGSVIIYILSLIK